MHLGVQYYRAPFPHERFWEDDFSRIRDAGLDTVQLWVLWGWVESAKGTYRFDDYDRLMDLAAKKGLGVVLSTIAEIQPYWIHRELPDSRMLDANGQIVISTNRSECHFGLTPGACIDHPGTWPLMRSFIDAVARRYGPASHLRGWDVWNELRWHVNGDRKRVCYCRHSIAAFRTWLDQRHGGLDGLNRAWNRRYASWDDVQPGRFFGDPYTEMMAFTHFITARCGQHAHERYRLVKAIDPRRTVTVHGCQPTALYGGWAGEHALGRGNDWDIADETDGIGCSSFPKWQGIDDADFGMRIEFVRSAARGKKVWLSEIQGGRAASGFTITDAVDAESQQRWIWNGVACGADMFLFWCWRDEVFGYEAGGFGLSGDDGLADERLAAMRRSGDLIDAHRELIAGYQPSGAEVGIWFSPQSYYLHYAQDSHGSRVRDAVVGYGRALVRSGIPYRMVEENHVDLDGLKVLFLPRTLVVDDANAARLIAFVEAGGTLMCESECGAFDPAGLYRYPAERFLAKRLGVREIGRRKLLAETTTVDGHAIAINQWATPWAVPEGSAWASIAEGALIAEIPLGKGRVILGGTYFAEPYRKIWNAGFERLVERVVRVGGWTPEVDVEHPQPDESRFVYIRHGTSGASRLVFVFLPSGVDSARLRLRPGFFRDDEVEDLISGQRVAVSTAADGQRITVTPPRWRMAVLTGAGG